MQSYYFVMALIYTTGTWVLLKYLYYKIHLILCKHSVNSEIAVIGLNKAKVISIQTHMWSRVIPLVSGAHQWGQVHPHRQDVIRVGVHIHSQGKLHIWSLNVVNSSAVHRLDDGPDLRERQMQGESWNLKKFKKASCNLQCFLLTDIVKILDWRHHLVAHSRDYIYRHSHFKSHPVVSQQALQLVAMPLSHVLPAAQLQFGQELFQGAGAVAVPAGWVTRPPLHDLLLQDLLNAVEGEMGQ